MKNIFLVYIPPSNHEAMVHYHDTIQRKVATDRIYRFIDANERERLDRIFGGRPIAVWGSRDSASNRAKFSRMSPGDEVLIIEGDTIKLLGKVADRVIKPELSRELWKNIHGGTTEGWDLIYFIANPVEIDLPFKKFCRLFGYAPNYQLRGFTIVGPDRLEQFYDQYDDLYSILLLLKQGRPYYEKPKTEELSENINSVKEGYASVEPEDVADAVNSAELSDHVRMQWKLIGLGIKCGAKVWVPVGDQSRISRNYNFTNFEENFAAGLDTQTRYVENIDVVWKEEFRIDAAFEIENTTAIYSGLLRFADLAIVAPNTVYPFFIVAPREKRNRLEEQLKRPVFKKLQLSGKVRYLSYEAVDDIDEFTRDMPRGLNVDIVQNKSEAIEV